MTAKRQTSINIFVDNKKLCAGKLFWKYCAKKKSTSTACKSNKNLALGCIRIQWFLTHTRVDVSQHALSWQLIRYTSLKHPSIHYLYHLFCTEWQTTIYTLIYTYGQFTSQSRINLTCICLHYGRKPEYTEKTHSDTERTCKLQYTQKGSSLLLSTN